MSSQKNYSKIVSGPGKRWTIRFVPCNLVISDLSSSEWEVNVQRNLCITMDVNERFSPVKVPWRSNNLKFTGRAASSYVFCSRTRFPVNGSRYKAQYKTQSFPYDSSFLLKFCNVKCSLICWNSKFNAKCTSYEKCEKDVLFPLHYQAFTGSSL